MPMLTVLNKDKKGGVHVVVRKNGFRSQKVEVYKNTGQAPQLLRVINVYKPGESEYEMSLSSEEISAGVFLKIEGDAGNTQHITM